jgi:hypothetical protein
VEPAAVGLQSVNLFDVASLDERAGSPVRDNGRLPLLSLRLPALATVSYVKQLPSEPCGARRCLRGASH